MDTAQKASNLLYDAMASAVADDRKSPAVEVWEIAEATDLPLLDVFRLMRKLTRAGMAEEAAEFSWQLPVESTAEFLPLK